MNDLDRMEEVIVKLKEEINSLTYRLNKIEIERVEVRRPFHYPYPWVYPPYQPYVQPYRPYDVWYSTSSASSTDDTKINIGEL